MKKKLDLKMSPTGHGSNPNDTESIKMREILSGN